MDAAVPGRSGGKGPGTEFEEDDSSDYSGSYVGISGPRNSPPSQNGNSGAVSCAEYSV